MAIELTDEQRLALAVALEKQLKTITDTRKPGSVRACIDDKLRDMYETAGVDRIRIKIGDHAVGTVSISLTKPEHGIAMCVDDVRALKTWLRESNEGADVLERLLTDIRFHDAITKIAMDEGFMPDGCRMVEVDEPARVKGTVVRVKPEDVAEALAGGLNDAVAGLLGGGR